jgi:alpha/beta superfamily hydrolase
MAWREKGVTIAVEDEGIVLEGVWQSGQTRAGLVAPPHPEYGGSLENPVVSEIAYGLHKAGFASLRFNWRGVGASQGQSTGDPRAADSDFRAALHHLHETVAVPVIGAGYSFGAAAALRVALDDPSLQSLLLVAPPLSMIQDIPIERVECPIRVIVGSQDPFAPARELSERLALLADGRLEVVPGVDHFFHARGLAAVCEFARAAFD